MAVQRPTLTTLTNTGGLDRLFHKTLDVYFASGALAASELPGNQIELGALISNAGEEEGAFVPFGRLAAEAGSITDEPVTGEIHKETITLRRKLNMALNSLEVNAAMVDYLDTEEAKGNLTFLFLAADQVEREDLESFIIVSGVSINHKKTFNINGDFATIEITAVKEAEVINGVHLHFNEDITA